MGQRLLATVCIAVVAAHVASAQSSVSAGLGGPGRASGRSFGPPPGGIDVRAVRPMELGEPVTGAPFSAEMVTQVVQEFADGNRIERRASSSMARDSVGRTRREEALLSVGPFVSDVEVRIVTISDPAQRVLYLLDPGRKAATKSRMREVRPPGADPRGSSPRPLRSRSDRDAVVGVRPERPEIRTERLGTREVAGVRNEGTRTTTTIPAGAFGNVRPIEVVDERWYSAELRLVMESRRTDPRSGTVEYQVTSLVRGEPPAELFQVPTDYSLSERELPPFGPPPRPGR